MELSSQPSGRRQCELSHPLATYVRLCGVQCLGNLGLPLSLPARGSHLLLVTLSTALVFELPRRILPSRDFLSNSEWGGSSWRHMAVILCIISAIQIRSHHHAVQESTYCSKTEAIMSAIMSGLCQLQGKASRTIHQNVLPPF